ncbi:OmpA family protein, partial [bacterium]|nr:OmpA family protein [bacterium]
EARLVLTGVVPTDVARTALEKKARELPAEGFALEVSLTVAVPNPAPALASTLRRDLESTKLRFQFASIQLTSSSEPLLDPLVELVKGAPELRLRITGHTDSVGSAAFNQALSERRAASIAQMLLSQGVSSASLVTEGRGESQPESDNRSDRGRAKNRRVEFELLGGT